MLRVITKKVANEVYGGLRSLAPSDMAEHLDLSAWTAPEVVFTIVFLSNVVVDGTSHDKILMLEGPTYYIKDQVKDLGFVWAQNIHEMAGLNRWVKALDEADDADGIAKDVTTIANKAGFDIKIGEADAVETWGEIGTED